MPKFSAPSHLLHKVQKPVTIFFALFFFWALQTNAQTTWYSRTDIPSSGFAVTTAWTDNPSGTGGNNPSPSVFTSGTDNFVVLSETTREINSDVTIRSLTVEGGTVQGFQGSNRSLTLKGNLINNGTFEIEVPLNFTGADNASVGGANSIGVSATITVNKSSGATLTLGANAISISSGNFLIQGGNFVAGSGTIELVSGADLTISTSGTVDFTTNQSQIDVVGSGQTIITSTQDINFHNIRNLKNSGGLNFTGTGGTRNFRIRGTYTRASNNPASSIGTLTNATFGYDGDAATLEYAATTSIDDEFVTTSGLEPRNLTISVGVSGTVSGSMSYTVPRNLTLTSGTIDLGTNMLTVSGNITGSTVEGGGKIAYQTTLNLGGGSTTTQKQTINGSITLRLLTIDKRYGNSPNDTEHPRNTVEVSGQLIFNPNGQLNIESGTLQFLTAGGLGGSNLGSLTITIGSSPRRGVLRTGGTDITTGAVGTVNAQTGTNGGNSKVIYDGTTGSNTMRSGAFGVIEIRRDVQVQSNATTTITSELIFHSGTISNTNTNNILVLNDGVPVTYVGTATPQTSYVSGPVRRVISSTTPAVFPVGKGGGGNRVTLTYQTAPSPAVTVQVEQFNAGVTSAYSVSGIFSLSSSRYWDISFASGSTGNNYRLEVDIAGSGIPSPLNRVVFRSSTNPDDYSNGFPPGADVDDDGTRATQAPNFPYTSFFTGRFTLGRDIGNLWISRTSGGGNWNEANTWEDENGNPRSAPPSLTSDVIIRNGRTVTISTQAEARSLAMDNVNGAGVLIINSTLDFSSESGVQWLSANTDFTAGTVKYQTGNIYGDTYVNLEINGATGTQNSNDATPVSTITVTGNLTKLSSTAFTSASSNPITVSGNYTNTEGDATYNGGLTVAGNATITAGNVGGTVTVSGGTLTMNGGSFNVSGGTLTLNNGSSNTINGSNASPIFNNLVFNIGTGSVTMSGSVTSVQVRGDFTLTGSGNVTNGEIIMNGSNPQAVLGLGSGTIQNFQINNSSSAGVTLNRALSARGTLTLTNGRLNTSATNIMSCTGTSGGSPTAYVNGPLQIGQVGTATAIYPKDYPVGDGTVYRPFEINTGPNANAVQRVRLVNSSPLSEGATPGGGLSAISAFRYWELTDGTGTAAGTQEGDQVVLGYVNNPVDDGINSLSPYPLRVAACSTLGGVYSPYGGADISSFLGVRGVQTNTPLTTNLRFYTLGSVNASDAPLPVELSFTGVSSRAGVVLSWETASERESAGFVINRRIVGIGSGEWQVIDDYTRNPNLRAKNSLNGAKYTYTDASDLPAGTVLEYRLDEVSLSGAIERLREVRVETRFSTVVTDFALEQNYPNPFNPTTSIPYQLKERAKVTLDIYNTLGQKVATVVDAVQERGNYAVNFNAASLASGMYFYRLTAQGASQTFVQTRKMMLLK